MALSSEYQTSISLQHEFLALGLVAGESREVGVQLLDCRHVGVGHDLADDGNAAFDHAIDHRFQQSLL